MAVKGLFFSLDAVFGVVIAVIIMAAFSFTMLRFEEDKIPTVYLSNLASDVLVSMDKNETLDTLDDNFVNRTLEKILPNNLGYILEVKAYRCSSSGPGGGCNQFTEVQSESFRVVSNPSSEKNPVIAKRMFLTFDDDHLVKFYNIAELRVWLK